MKIATPINFTLTSSNVTGSAYSNWSSVTAYSIGNRVYLPTNYGEYEALTANTNKSPDANPLDWKFLGTTNKYKMFDQFLNTQTTNTGTITFEVVAYGCQAVYLGNIDAVSVQIQIVNNDTLAVIESKTFSMYQDPINWVEYFYGDWIANKQTSVTYERTTLTQNVSVLVTINNGVGVAKCGIFLTGRIKNIGVTKWGLKLGALDYSTVSTNQTSGVTYLTRGNYAKRIDADLFAYTSTVPAVYKALTDIRATPVLFISEGYEDFNVYGYVQTWENLVSGPVETAITLQIIGLI